MQELILSMLVGRAPDWVVVFVTSLLGVVAIFTFVIFSNLAAVWIERRLLGRFQIRSGPNRTGPEGLLQPLADALKVVGKEAIMPFAVDKWVYLAAPAAVFAPAILSFAVIPYAPGLTLLNIDVGILFLGAVGSVGVVPIFMAGWSSNNKYSLLGAMRAIAVTVSYEIPLILSLIGILVLGATLHLETLGEYQIEHGWFLFLQPLAFIIFFIAGSAELNRTPTDIMEGESELTAGFHTEYSGFKFTLFYLAEYTHVLAFSAVIVTLFMGGWGSGPGLDLIPPALWFAAKMYLIFCVFVWTRATLPRMRIDQLMGFAWKFLIPLTLMNILITAIEVYVGLASIPIFLINTVLAAVLVVLWTRVVSVRGVAVNRSEYVARMMSQPTGQAGR